MLVYVYTLPQAVKQTLVLSPGDPVALGLWASHYVHFTEGHLVENLVSYALLAPTCYVLCALAGRRRRFWGAFAAFLLAYPVVLSGSDLLLGRPGVSYGFSGVAMAFFGFLGVSLFTFLGERWEGVSLDHSPAVFFAGASLIAFVALPTSRGSLAAGAAAALIAGAYTLSWYCALPVGALRRALEKPGDVELPAFTLCLFVATAFAAFPTDPFRGDYVLVNVYVHFVGYCTGFVPPFAALQLLAARGGDRENESAGTRDAVSGTLSAEGRA